MSGPGGQWGVQPPQTPVASPLLVDNYTAGAVRDKKFRRPDPWAPAEIFAKSPSLFSLSLPFPPLFFLLSPSLLPSPVCHSFPTAPPEIQLSERAAYAFRYIWSASNVTGGNNFGSFWATDNIVIEANLAFTFCRGGQVPPCP